MARQSITRPIVGLRTERGFLHWQEMTSAERQAGLTHLRASCAAGELWPLELLRVETLVHELNLADRARADLAGWEVSFSGQEGERHGSVMAMVPGLVGLVQPGLPSSKDGLCVSSC